MQPRSRLLLLAAQAAVAVAATTVPARARAEETKSEGNPEVLAKGPIHEAFAEPVTFDPEHAFIVPKEPPKPIEEIPPDVKPEGANVQWIPGYWAWDEDKNDFIWVSGLWRDVPPGKHWVPGTFAETSGGWQWSPGYWTSDQEAKAVASTPPATLEAGPTSDPPSEEYVWMPGTWIWTGSWAWRPGYWMVPDPDYVWVPAYWVWTPRGYVFIDGYWDYLLARRGYLYAPVYWGPGWVWRPHYRWRPAVVIRGDILLDHFFCQPRYAHYYYGDYYASEHIEHGIYPWFSVHMSRYGYDPIYAHTAWANRRTNPEWETQVRQEYHARQHDPQSRPARTVFTRPATEVQRSAAPLSHARPMPRMPETPRADATIRPERHPPRLEHPAQRLEHRALPAPRPYQRPQPMPGGNPPKKPRRR